MGCLVFIGVLFWPVGHKVHCLHNFPAALDADADVEFTPQIGLECALSRNKAQFPDDLPEQFLQFILMFPFFRLRAIHILLTIYPRIIAGARHTKYMEALRNGQTIFFFRLPADKRIRHLKPVRVYLAGFDDIFMAANSERSFF